MLVLSRKELQQVIIGTDIRITVVRTDRNRVRLGIEAPGSMTILRGELAPIAAPGRGDVASRDPGPRPAGAPAPRLIGERPVGRQKTPVGGGPASSPANSSPPL